jgi:predicted dehydrogenase
VREADRAATRREADAMVQAARSADRVLDVAFNHRQRGDIQELKRSSTPAASGSPTTPRRGGCAGPGIPTLGSWFTRAELAGGGPLVDIGVHVLDYSLFLLGNPGGRGGQRLDLRPARQRGLRSSPGSKKTGATGGRPSTWRTSRSVFMRLADGGTLLVEAQLGRAPRATATSSASRCTAPTAAPS